MGKRGKRRRRSKDSTKYNNNASCTVCITGNEDLNDVHPWKFNVFTTDDGTTHQADFREYWQALEKRKRGRLIPTAIQLHVWPFWMLSCRDLVGIAPTSSGKTLSFGLPLVMQTGNALVIVPTRELARQVQSEVESVTKRKVICIYGGVDRSTQVESLREAIRSNEPWIVTASPGRLVDVLQDASIPTDLQVESIVLDEADRMASNAEMANQVDEILQRLQSKRTCLFSATSPYSVEKKWKEWIGEDSVCIKVNTTSIGEKSTTTDSQESSTREASAAAAADTGTQDEGKAPPAVASVRVPRQLDFAKIPPHVTQILHVCAAHKKPRKLVTTLQKIRQDEGRHCGLCLVFFARKKTLQYVSNLLKQQGYKVAELHGQLSQTVREQTLLNFKSGKVPTLLASDIAARGIHVNNIQYVINYDFPGSLDQYVHRCGRAGRSSSKNATVYSFFTRNLAPMARDVVSLLESSNAWIDPNLRELVGTDEASTSKKRKREQLTHARTDKVGRNLPVENAGVDEDDWDDGQFENLNAHRVVLQRASHVSDASSDSDDE